MFKLMNNFPSSGFLQLSLQTFPQSAESDKHMEVSPASPWLRDIWKTAGTEGAVT